MCPACAAEDSGPTLRRDPSGGAPAATAAAQAGGSPAPQPHATIGRYMLLEVLGRGGMGLVYTAYDPVLGRNVAIKVLQTRSQSPTDGGAESTRLLREAQAMARLNHPNVVPVYDFGVAGNDVYVAMELVVGTTLHAWLKQQRPDFRQALPVLIAAGRGLQAAHEAGLLHRDFKPANVLLDAALRPRLTDFGLARALGSPTSGPTPSIEPSVSGPVAIDLQLTRAGAVMGTPGYMAPEQYRGAATSPATDQYAYCVALYEAFYGRRPFEAKDLEELGRLANTGEVPPPPRGSPVPSWVFPIVKRGLATDPAARHASMAALLDALSRDPSRRRRAWMAAAAVAAATVVALVGHQALQARAERNCRAQGRSLAGLWDDTVRARGEAKFAATGMEWAAVAWQRSRAAADAYAAAVVQARNEACEARWADGTLEAPQLALRMACLDRRLDELDTLAQTFASADLTVVTHATTVVARLSPVVTCLDTRGLAAEAEAWGHTRDTVDRLQRELARGRLLMAAGLLAEARQKIESSEREAVDLGNLVLAAGAHEARGELEFAAGQIERARDALQRGTEAALRAGNQVQAARQLATLVTVVGWRLERPAEGLVLASVARGLLGAAGGDRAVEARLEEGVGDAQWQAGDKKAALVSYQRSLAALVALHGEENEEVARLRLSIGFVQLELGQLDDAQAMLERARDIRQRLLGPDHPSLAETWNALGALSLDLGDLREADRRYLESLRVYEAKQEPDAFPLTRTLLNLVGVRVARGRLDEARAPLERATANLRNMPNPPASARMQVERARARIAALAGDFATAKRHAQDAVDLTQKAFGRGHAYSSNALQVQAEVLLAAGELEAAVATADRFLESLPEVPMVAPAETAGVLVVSARALLGLRRAPEAVRRLERALAIVVPLRGRRRETCDAQRHLAEALWVTGGDRVRARTLATQARDGYLALESTADAEQTAAWLAAHP